MFRILLRAAAVVLVTACQQPPTQPARTITARGPQVEATVVTIRTTLQPANRVTTHQLIIGESTARSLEEADRWRLYDLKAGTVTTVNELERTYRTEPVAALVAQRRAALRQPSERDLPVAQFQPTGAQRQILNQTATQSLIRLGGYQRELWFATHPLIPDELFAVMHGTTPPATRLGAIVAQADDALIAARGFPLLDRAELPYGESNMTVERSVVAIERKQVPAELLQIPRDYREIKEPDASRQPASSRPPGQRAPAAGSPPSATTQKAP